MSSVRPQEDNIQKQSVSQSYCDKEECNIMWFTIKYETTIKALWILITSLYYLHVQTPITRRAQSSWSAGHLTTALPWLRGSVAAYRCGVYLELTSSALWERILRRFTNTHTHTHTHTNAYTLHLNSYQPLYFLFCFFNFCVLPSGIVLMVPRRTPLKSALW